MTSTARIAQVLRGALVAGVIGAATVGMAGNAGAAVLTPAPTVLHTQFVDYDDDGGGYEAPEAPAYEEPAYEAPEAPAYEEPQPAEEAPAEQAPVEEAPAETPAPEEAPVEEAPVEEAPVEEAPVEEPQPAETPVEEAPVEEAPAEESPVAPEVPADEPAPSAPEVPDVPAPADAPGDAGPTTVTPATAADVSAAAHATVVDANASTVSTSTVSEVRSEILTEMTSTTSVTSWDRQVTQWNSSWISYDANYRPVLLNPFRTPLQVFYTYGNAPRTVTVQPLSRAVFDVPHAGVYNFTGLRRTPSGALTSVSVGSFTGGGFVPAPGRPGPTKPVAPPASKNVLVRLQYANGSSEPFRIKQLTDLGDDTAVHARRVLIDGTTSAWGHWTRTASGEREFDITKTLQLPGLAGPGQSPIPGYKVAVQKH